VQQKGSRRARWSNFIHSLQRADACDRHLLAGTRAFSWPRQSRERLRNCGGARLKSKRRQRRGDTDRGNSLQAARQIESCEAWRGRVAEAAIIGNQIVFDDKSNLFRRCIKSSSTLKTLSTHSPPAWRLGHLQSPQARVRTGWGRIPSWATCGSEGSRHSTK
jgi:hypothetical protein